MNLQSKVLLGAAAVAALTATSAAGVKASAATVKNVPVYRVYNKKTGEHLYTTSKYEYTQLPKQDKNWRDESLVWNASSTGTPVYRVYNKKTGEHLWTASKYEANVLVSRGWRLEGGKNGIAFYSPAASKSYTPVYRVYNPKGKEIAQHLNTTSAYEAAKLVSMGWRSEGTAFYGFGASAAAQKQQAWLDYATSHVASDNAKIQQALQAQYPKLTGVTVVKSVTAGAKYPSLVVTVNVSGVVAKAKAAGLNDAQITAGKASATQKGIDELIAQAASQGVKLNASQIQIVEQ